MRGRKRSRNTREYMLLRNGSIFIFVIIFILIGTGYSLLTTPLEITGKATINVQDPDEPVEPGLSVATLKTVNYWGQGCVMIISVTNNDDNYDEWEFCFEVPENTTDVMLHNNSYVFGAICNFEGNKVTINMNKVNEDGSTNWMAPWEKGTKKDIQIEFIFNTINDNIILKNVILNNKLITSELIEAKDTTSENEVTETDTTNNTVDTNVITEENNIQNVTEENSNNLVNQNNIE